MQWGCRWARGSLAQNAASSARASTWKSTHAPASRTAWIDSRARQGCAAIASACVCRAVATTAEACSRASALRDVARLRDWSRRATKEAAKLKSPSPSKSTLS
eukprot:1548590-Pleurochrysis_carterae.AAC.1